MNVRKPAAIFDKSESQRVIYIPVDPQINSDAKLSTRPILLVGKI